MAVRLVVVVAAAFLLGGKHKIKGARLVRLSQAQGAAFPWGSGFVIPKGLGDTLCRVTVAACFSGIAAFVSS